MGPATVGEVPRLVGAVLDRKNPWDVLEQMRHQPTIARGSARRRAIVGMRSFQLSQLRGSWTLAPLPA